ncbi:cell division protein FtsK, partial [Kribbella solani]|nr:cell division protein FtsK [Kribbella solani]
MDGMDNVHMLHPDNDPHDRPQDSVQDDAQDVAEGIVRGSAVRVDATAGEVVDGEVIEGEILTDEESAVLDERLANRGALVRHAVTTSQVVARASRTVATHDRTKTAGKVVLREG